MSRNSRDFDADLVSIDIDGEEALGDVLSEEEEKRLKQKKAARKKAKKRKAFVREVLSTSLYLLVVLLCTLLIVKFVGQRTVVIGSSMEPTLSDGNNLIVDKISYRIHAPERFDIIVFPFQYEKNTFYIKRIIGLPGETVRIDEQGNIYINEVLLEEHYGAEVMTDPGLAYNGIALGDDEYFVLGDNRNHSSDSRSPAVGIINRKDIIGRAWLRIYPFSQWGFVKHA